MAAEALPVPLSRKQADALLAALETPLPIEWAAKSEGVTPKQVEAWLFAGITGSDPECVRFAKLAYKVQAGNIGLTMKGLLTLAKKGNPLAAEAFLRLMHPVDFGGKARSGPDEFQAAERSAARRERLLDDPPPRMRAELARKRWVQLPAGISAEDKATIEAILARYRTAPALPPAEKAE